MINSTQKQSRKKLEEEAWKEAVEEVPIQAGLSRSPEIITSYTLKVHTRIQEFRNFALFP